MSLDLYLAFVAATTVLILIPGPNVTLLVATSLAHGPRRALSTLAGTSAAIALQLSVVLLGMTSFVLLLTNGLEWLRWLGVGYLLYLGIQQWRAVPLTPDEVDPSGVASSRLFWQGFLVCATNPKMLLFYAAFFPQFVDPGAAMSAQLVLLCATFLTIATALDGGYVLLAGRLRDRLRNRSSARLRNRLTGSLLIATGLGLALARRS